MNKCVLWRGGCRRGAGVGGLGGGHEERTAIVIFYTIITVGGYTTEYICQNSSNYILKIGEL